MTRPPSKPAARTSHRVPLLLGLSALLLTSLCHAQTAATRTAPDVIWLAASDQTLDRLRGGFDLGAGLFVSFGISRAVFINGQLITSTSFQVGDLSRITIPQAAALGQQIAVQNQVVQNGGGNVIQTSPAPVPLATYIQNTLNDQTIRNQTIIEVTSNGMGIVKGLNLQATIDEAVARAIATR